MTPVDRLFALINDHERKLRGSISFIPSENAISPVSRLAFLSDAYSRYFFGEKEVFDRWSFEGGSIAGVIQSEILVPALAELAGAEFVDVRPVSGLTAMTVALAAFGGAPGDLVLTVPVANGGHPDTSYVAAKLGYRTGGLPFADYAAPDLDELGRLVATQRPSLIYIDHATALFPLDLAELIKTVRAAQRAPVHVHVDTSHVNGLVLGGQLPNPLACGADSFGGSTHKTFPGPHKAVLFTNDPEVSDRLTENAVNMISHHHMSDVIALTIAVLEFVDCGGADYAEAVLGNARAFAAALHARGLDVQGADRGFTRSHQVWLASGSERETYAAGSRLFAAGLIVNPYDPIPSIGGAGIRLGLNEPTRLGFESAWSEPLAEIFAGVLGGSLAEDAAAARVAEIRGRLRPRFCYGPEVLVDKLQGLVAGTRDGEADRFGRLAEFLYS